MTRLTVTKAVLAAAPTASRSPRSRTSSEVAEGAAAAGRVGLRRPSQEHPAFFIAYVAVRRPMLSVAVARPTNSSKGCWP